MPSAAAPVAGSQVADYVEAYESARADSDTASLTDFLPERTDPHFRTVLAELVRVEMEYAWTSGRPKRLKEYRQAHPELFDDPAVLADVAFEEYRLRRLAGEPVSPREYRQDYGVSVGRWPGDGEDMPTQRLGDAPYPSIDADLDDDFPKIGTTFLGFHLHAELGRGAFGRVYLAHQGDLADRPVALKITRDARVESQALARLQHTNVMPIYSVHSAPPFHAVCMPYFPGVTLADLCRGFAGNDTTPDSARALLETVREKSTPTTTPTSRRSVAARPIDNAWAAFHDRSGTEAVVWIGMRLADGLAHAHERGIVHRDLKPANVLLTEDGQPLILDFNLADDAQADGQRAFLGGTLPYMAPQQLQSFLNGKPHSDPCSDIYSLGIILFELLTNRSPFPAHKGDWRTAALAGLADRNGPPPRLRPLNPSVSPAVEAIVRHCLEPDLDRRFSTAAALHEDLRRQFNHLPLRHTREPSRREQVAKFFRRHPGTLSATRIGVVAAILIAGLAAGLVIRGNRLATLEARNDAEQWMADAHPVQLRALRSDFDVDEWEQSSAQAAGLLARWDLPNNAAWFESRAVRRLPDEERVRLRREVGDLLYLQAGKRLLKFARTTASNLPDRSGLLDEAEHLNGLAAGSYPSGESPRALYRQRAVIQGYRGNSDEATTLQRQAESVPLRTARDYVHEAFLPQPVNDVLRLLDEAQRLHPGSANLWSEMGLAYRRVNRVDRAIQCFDMSLILNSDQLLVHELRGEMRLAAGEFGRAIADFDAVLATHDSWDAARSNRALARENVGDLTGAIADLTDVLERSPDHVDLLLQRARVKTKNRDAAGAKADLTELVKRTPVTVRGWIARALAQSNPQNALADLDQALALDPESEQALQNRANIFDQRLQQPQEAIAALDRLLKSHPTSADALAGRGVLLARRGDREPALRDARAALAADRKPVTVYQVAGIYALTSRKERGDLRESLHLLAEAFRRDPSTLRYVATDNDLDPIRENQEFRKLLDAARLMLTVGG